MKNNWQIKRLGEISDLVRGPFGGSLKKEIFVESGYSVYEQGNVIDNNLENFRYFITKDKYSDMKRFKVLPGDILMSCSGTIGRFVIVPQDYKEGIINQALLKITPKKNIHINFLKYILQTYFSKNNSYIKGMAIKNIASVKELKNITIPFPSLPEQKQIVAQLETLLSKTREAKRLNRESQLATQTLLSAELHKIFEDGKNQGWEEKEIQGICEHPQYGYTASSSRAQIGPKFLRITDIQNGKVNWNEVPYCFCDEAEKYQLKKGDIVFARTGATVGKSYLIQETPEATIFASYLIRLRIKKEVIPEFIYYFFHSPYYWQQITQGQAGMAQPNLNGSKLSKLKLPLPPLPEQQKIVSHLDSLSTKIANLREYQKTVLAEIATLEQSILHQVLNESG